MKNELKEAIKALTEDERRELITYITNTLIHDTSINEAGCKNCYSKRVIKYGLFNGTQRFKCKDCNKTFISSTKSMMYHSRVSKDTWMRFIDYELAGLSLKEIAYFLKLSVTTCFNMRHKLYKAAFNYLDSVKLSGNVEIDCSYQKINLKGTKPHNMPRISKKRGGKTTFSGISCHKVCIMTAIDEHDTHIMRIIGLGHESYEKFKVYDYLFNNPKLLISDKSASIIQYSNHLKASCDFVPVNATGPKIYVTAKGNNIQALNQFAGSIKELIHKKRGVAIKYLNEYLAFESLKKMIGYKFTREERANRLIEFLSKFVSKNKRYK